MASHLLSFFVGSTSVAAIGYFYLSDQLEVYAKSLESTTKHLNTSTKHLTDIRTRMDYLDKSVHCLSSTQMTKATVQQEIEPIQDLLKVYQTELNQLAIKVNALQKQIVSK